MRIFFPVVSPQREGEAIGCAEVFVGEQAESEAFPHERFAVDNALNAWALLFPHKHWPEPLCWRACPCNPQVTGADEPRRWRGASANLATFLAMAHAKKPFRARWLNTDHLWASAALSPQGTNTHIQEVDFLAQKLTFFLEKCKTRQEHGRPGVFVLPAVSLQKIKKILESPLGIGVQVEVFEPSKPPTVRDAPLILLVKLNQLSALVAALRQDRVRQTKQRLTVCVALALALFGLAWWALLPWQRIQVSSTIASKKSLSSHAILLHTVQSSTPTKQPFLPNEPRQGSLTNPTSDLPPLLRPRTPAHSKQHNALDQQKRVAKKEQKKTRKTKRVYASPPQKKKNAERALSWVVEIQPLGYLEEHRLETALRVSIQGTKLMIPADTPETEVVVAHRKDKMAYETCTLQISIGMAVLWLHPLQKRTEIAQSPSYCLVQVKRKKQP